MLPTPNPDVVFAALEGGAVLFSKRDETYYGLNASGARVWEMLPPAFETLDSLCAELQSHYRDVGSDVLRGDVRELLDELSLMGLVSPRHPLRLHSSTDDR